ncbi:MAG: alpha-L-rhamnosidase N-terminal domain-containing protein, partial [Methylococcaceae bacterium]|nr:alpha-L-rhamnosidase N-terminal domain-containing protein [Methylococcaceae bacterium]
MNPTPRPTVTHLLTVSVTLFVAVSGYGNDPHLAPSTAHGALFPAHLRCDYRVAPLGIDAARPRLSWIVTAAESHQRGLRQTAYQGLVASDRNRLAAEMGDLWDSGKVASDGNSQIFYSGRPLESGIDCYWKVRVWDNSNRPSAWSEASRWSMGLLKPQDWSARWIGYTYKAKTDPKLPQATYWRKGIVTGKKVARAMLYASALGSYIATINGQRVGNDSLNPGWTDFRKRVYYHTYDVTSMLRRGHNALAAILSTGWYAGYIWAGPFNYGSTPKLLLQLNGNFECSDGRVNQLYKNCVNTLIANLVDLPTGCSDRAERLGWMGLGQMIYSWCYSFDMNAFLTKWMADIVDAQSLGKSGAYLQVSPIWGDIESPGWSDDGVCVPYTLYRFYGNTRIVEANYESLQKYLGHIERSLTGYLRTGPVFHVDGQKFIGYGDWLAIVEDREQHADVPNTLWNGWSVSNMAELANAIGLKEDAENCARLLKN